LVTGLGMKQILNFYFNTVPTIVSTLKILLHSKFRPKFPKAGKEDVIILGNGPSLNDLLNDERYLQVLKTNDCIAVNYFHKSEFFAVVKPKYYIVAGLEFWEDNFPHSIESRLQLYQSLAKEVDWPMYFIIPYLARKKPFWKEIVSQNPHITILYFNYVIVEGFPSIKHAFYNRKLGQPRLQNIVGCCIMNMIWIGYKRIYLTGVEHSWLPNINVNKNNETLIGYQHFFNRETITSHMPKENNEAKKLHEVIYKFYTTFRGYWDIKKYIANKDVKIINLTESSFIDAFEKKSIDEVF
jgi:hypothetical protein